MPATSGRVRMPHNNRVSTAGALHTSSIWKQTIGHDPYANKEVEAENEAMRLKTAEQAKGLLELARHRNLANNSSTSMGSKVAGGDDFARKMFLGLKPKKRRRDTTEDGNSGGDGATSGENKIQFNDLGEESSSSEEEFLQVEVEEGHSDSSSSVRNETSRSHKKKKSSSSRKKKKGNSSKKEKRRYDCSSDDEVSKRRRKKHRSREKRKEKKRKRSESSSSSSA